MGTRDSNTASSQIRFLPGVLCSLVLETCEWHHRFNHLVIYLLVHTMMSSHLLFPCSYMACVWVPLLPDSDAVVLSPGRCQPQLSICPQSCSLCIILRTFSIVLISKPAFFPLISSYGSSGRVFSRLWVTSISTRVPGRVNIHYISDYILEKEMERYVCLGDKGCIVLGGRKNKAATTISIDGTSMHC